MSYSNALCDQLLSMGKLTVQVPQRLYTLDELKLNGIETTSFLSPVDATLGSIERNLQLAAVLGGLVAWNTFAFSPQQILYFSLGLLFLWTFDSVSSSCLPVTVSGKYFICYVTAGIFKILKLSLIECLLSWLLALRVEMHAFCPLFCLFLVHYLQGYGCC